MKKQWIKRENMYYKPFYKQKFKMLLVCIFLLGILFIVYQFFSINELTYSSTPVEILDQKYQQAKTGGNDDYNSRTEDKIVIMRGIRLFDFDAYKPNYMGNFKCLDGSAEFPFSRVNDDYCDCISDGSDEPSTNACNKGRFFCKYQKRHVTGRGRDVSIPSSFVNDFVCDCCDGSDEFTTSVQCKQTCTS